MQRKITVVDYGMGNIWSVLSAFRYLGQMPEVTSNPDIIATAETLILPGVGSFRKAMEKLHSSGIAESLNEAVMVKGSKILGICLGMQLMGEAGSEDGYTKGLGFIEQSVEKFSSNEIGSAKLPHIGFNLVHSESNSVLFSGLPDLADFYFVHSFRMQAESLPGKVSICNYGAKFLAAYEQNNIFATQFHPEKSQTNGLVLLNNFIQH